MRKIKCKLCSIEKPKYKCPSCRIHYCSIPCYQQHKNSCCSPAKDSKDEQAPRRKSYLYPTDDTVPIDKMSLIGESEKVREILKDRFLRDLLLHVNTSSDPSIAVQNAMQVPEFVQFVDECLSIVEPE
ncbi:hypothetical protein J437_LFUL014848 [Ladona fulva]|uniref:HIT-type domain-containing protein n=1 Tax=Ladona fulva TaxID=123851 RepID=A0A8K0KGW6_LADFU|nr:hypothetical protein J437_LFUL014848 [Ladona fulva]